MVSGDRVRELEAAIEAIRQVIADAERTVDHFALESGVAMPRTVLIDDLLDALDAAPGPRVVSTVEELDALPVTAVIREQLPIRATGNDLSRVWEKWNGGEWVCIGGDPSRSESPELPARIIWLPEETP